MHETEWVCDSVVFAAAAARVAVARWAACERGGSLRHRPLPHPLGGITRPWKTGTDVSTTGKTNNIQPAEYEKPDSQPLSCARVAVFLICKQNQLFAARR
jgi:hypothetical protein